MNVSIFYRSATVWNIILFTLLIFFFLYLQEGLFRGRTVFDLQFLKESITDRAILSGLLGLSGLSIFLLKKSSRRFFVISCLAAVLITVQNLHHEFSKLVVISLFVFSLVAYYFYQFLKIETDEAYYNPMYDQDHLFEPMLKRLNVRILDQGTSCELEGWLTNWNPNGCFVFLATPLPEGVKLKKVKLQAELGNRQFEMQGRLAAKATDGKGFGFRMAGRSGSEFGWKDYYSIIEQMGFNVEFLK